MKSLSPLSHSRSLLTRSSVSSASSEFIPALWRQDLTFLTHQRTRRSVSDVSFRCTLMSVRRSLKYSPVISLLLLVSRIRQQVTHSATRIILSSSSPWSSLSRLSKSLSSLRAVLHRRRCLSLSRSSLKKTRRSVHTPTRKQDKRSSQVWVSFTSISSLTVCSVSSRLRLT